MKKPIEPVAPVKSTRKPIEIILVDREYYASIIHSSIISIDYLMTKLRMEFNLNKEEALAVILGGYIDVVSYEGNETHSVTFINKEAVEVVNKKYDEQKAAYDKKMVKFQEQKKKYEEFQKKLIEKEEIAKAKRVIKEIEKSKKILDKHGIKY